MAHLNLTISVAFLTYLHLLSLNSLPETNETV